MYMCHVVAVLIPSFEYTESFPHACIRAFFFFFFFPSFSLSYFSRTPDHSHQLHIIENCRQFASTPSQPPPPPPPYPSLTLARSFGVFCARMHGTCTHTSTNALSLARVRKRTNTRQPDAKRDARASTRRTPLAKPLQASTRKGAASRQRSVYTGPIPRTHGPLTTLEGHGC